MNRPRKKREVENGLLRKGFVQSNTDHNYFTYFLISGEKTSVKTKTSYGAGNEINSGLVKAMAQQCRLNVEDFHRLIDCPLSREDYETKTFSVTTFEA